MLHYCSHLVVLRSWDLPESQMMWRDTEKKQVSLLPKPMVPYPIQGWNSSVAALSDSEPSNRFSSAIIGFSANTVSQIKPNGKDKRMGLFE